MELTIAGFRDVEIVDVDLILRKLRAALSKIGENDFQLFDADRVAGKRHLQFAALNALAALKGGYIISKSLGVEAAVYASCQRQISKAFKLVGLNPETRRVAALVFHKSGSAKRFINTIRRMLRGFPDDSILEEWSSRVEELRKLYGISEAEFKAAKQALGEADAEVFLKLLWERMALLS